MKSGRLGPKLRVVLLLGGLVGCGGGSSGLPAAGIMPAPASCGMVDPCGGDPTGTWQVAGGCITSAELDNGSCTQVQLRTLSFTGSLTLNSDMTYEATDFTETRAEIDTTPVSCWGYQMRTCAEEDQSLKAQVSPRGSLSYASCTGSTTCACTIAETAMTVIEGPGTYAISGNQITFTAASGAGSYGGSSYCVQDGLFHLLESGTVVVDSTGTTSTVVYQDIVAQPK